MPSTERTPESVLVADRASTRHGHGADGRDATAAGTAAAPARERISTALGLAALIVVAEYLARRVLAPALPVLGSPTVNDMLAAALSYGLLVTAAAPPEARSFAALRGAIGRVLMRSRTWLPWLGACGFLGGVLVIAPIDAQVWGSIRLPSYMFPPSTTTLFASAATPLAIASLLLVNGVVIPLAEERLWRGLIMPRLCAVLGLAPGLLLVSILFSLKHVIVDASLGRLLAITVGGLVLGVVAYLADRSGRGETGWHASAVSHMVGNIIATSLALMASLA